MVKSRLMRDLKRFYDRFPSGKQSFRKDPEWDYSVAFALSFMIWAAFFAFLNARWVAGNVFFIILCAFVTVLGIRFLTPGLWSIIRGKL